MKLFRIYHKTKRVIDHENYKKAQNLVNYAVKSDKINESKRLVESFRTNKKAFYGFIRNKQTVKSRVSQLKNSDDTLTVNDHKRQLRFFQLSLNLYLQLRMTVICHLLTFMGIPRNMIILYMLK